MKFLVFLDSKRFTFVLSIIAGSLLTATLWLGWSPLETNSIFAQNTFYQSQFLMEFDYEKAWREVLDFQNQGLPKSALEKVETILVNARAENESAQFIKALIYQSKFKSQLEEDGLVESIYRVEKEIEKAGAPVKNILQSMLAEIYSGYLDNNVWQFRNRTETSEFKPQDIRTWTIQQIQKQSADLYLESLKGNGLKKTSVDEFEILLEEGHNDLGLRPTLFDFLAHRAIDHFMNERNYLSQPAYKFYIDSPMLFGTAAEFTRWKIETKDTSSQKLKTLLLLQELTEFHLEKDVEHNWALLDVELKRLKFVHFNSVLGNKDELYIQALEKLEKRYEGHEGEADILAAKAQYLYQKGSGYRPVPLGEKEEDGARKWLLKEAFSIAKNADEKYPSTVGATLCRNIMEQITEPSLSIKLEEVNIPGKPFLGQIEYRNTKKIWVRIFRFNEKRKKELEEHFNRHEPGRKSMEYLASLNPVKAMSFDLPDDGSYHRHTVEVPFEELPLGFYLIQIADNEGFEYNKGASGNTFTHVSNLGSWQRMGANGSSTFVVFDRKSGAPLEGVTAEFYSNKYNAILRRNELKKAGSSVSNSNGFIQPKLNEKNRNFSLMLRKGKDTLFTDRSFYDGRNRNSQRPYEQTHFFLDRAIYRPGQTVYFKGIALSFDSERQPTIIENRKVTVTFFDANYQEVEKLELVTNEYGTFNGNFTAPLGGLRGRMSIQSSIGGHRTFFRVEEYKRPKFEVQFNPTKESYRLDDKVKVNGFAKAYAGNNIDGAEVKWRVVRHTYFPWYRWGWWNPYPNKQMEIANGVSTTDENGQFSIDFTALPDLGISADKKPEFSYTVYADVTDITGETRSNHTTVKVGYVALNADILVDEKVHSDSLNEFSISTKNLNGEFEPAKGIVLLEQLDVPEQIYIQRYWEGPTSAIMGESEFKKSFPNYAWAGDDKPENWKASKTVLTQNFDTEVSEKVTVSKAGLPIGHYRVTLKTKDKYGVDVELKKQFTVFNFKGKKLPTPTIGLDYFDPKIYEPGSEATLHVGSSLKTLHLLLEVEKDGERIIRKWMNIKGVDSYIQKIKEEHRGNLNYKISYAALNRSFNKGGVINVPWSNKELTIEYGTFRDKMLPGSDEEWIVKIKGPKGEKVAAEMVAGMYDASLDAFAKNAWALSPFSNSYSRVNYSSNNFGFNGMRQVSYHQGLRFQGERHSRAYDRLNWFDWYFSQQYRYYEQLDAEIVYDAETYEEKVSVRGKRAKSEAAPGMAMSFNMASSDVVFSSTAFGTEDEGAPPPPTDGAEVDLSQVKVRTNLNETVFFFPNLMTDEEGNVLIKFKMNEALTKWKFLGLAHTQDLKIGTTSKEVITQKELMVVPNPPRFYREYDEIEFSAKVVNLSDKPLSPSAKLELKNAITGADVFGEKNNLSLLPLRIIEPIQPGQSKRLSWRFKVPEITDVSLIEHTVIASAGEFSDAERDVVPVVSNRMLVTETMPLPVRGGEEKTFTFERLKENDSPTLKHESLTLEFTQNPAWYAVQALPYLMEYPYQCTEQIFSRFYANSLATSMANSHPKIKTIFDRWRNYEPDALLSNLSKNQELKTALLEETPWVLNAQSEEQQKRNIALLFDLNRMSQEQATALKKLQDRQMVNGGWAWFPGGRDNHYITQYVVEGLGHLQKLGVRDIESDPATWSMVEKAVWYCDERMVEQYERLEQLVKAGKTSWDDDHLNYIAAHYLYTRSFFLENKSGTASTGGQFATGKQIELKGKAKKVHDYYIGQAKEHWLKKGIYVEGMLALGLHRDGELATAKSIVRSLDERSLNHDELGMYWKYPRGWWWYQAPIETHALMIEAFSDIGDDPKKVDDLKVWLLKNKQTNHWKTTKSTSAAVYALLSSGDNWLLDDAPLNISLPASKSLTKQVAAVQKKAEAGTGYFKTRIDGEKVSSDQAVIQVGNPNKVVAWGAMYWQYFEQLDNITTFEETPLKINKQLFRVKNGDRGEVMTPVNEGDQLKVGEKLKVRIELRSDRDMEYLHLKDMRASGFEPINVLSHYKWQGGMGYYESTRDLATDFFISYLPKGTYVFEYPLRVVHNGDFSNGITTCQSMYAPEFSSHSEGVRVKVEN